MLEEFKQILKKEGLTGKEFCELCGINYDTYRGQTKKSAKKTPKYIVTAVEMYKMGFQHLKNLKIEVK